MCFRVVSSTLDANQCAASAIYILTNDPYPVTIISRSVLFDHCTQAMSKYLTIDLEYYASSRIVTNFGPDSIRTARASCLRPRRRLLQNAFHHIGDSKAAYLRMVYVRPNSISACSMRQRSLVSGPGSRIRIYETISPYKFLFSNEPLRQDVSDQS